MTFAELLVSVFVGGLIVGLFLSVTRALVWRR